MIPFESGNFWKIEGVIQGSRTSQPPMLTPRIFSLPQLKPEGRSARFCLVTASVNVGSRDASPSYGAATAKAAQSTNKAAGISIAAADLSVIDASSSSSRWSRPSSRMSAVSTEVSL